MRAKLLQQEDLKGYGTIQYHPNGITNILSLQYVKKNRVTYGSSMMTGFVEHKADGTKHMFKPSKKWLFVSDVE